MRRILCLPLLLLTARLAALDPGATWETFGPEEGLSGSSVTAIAQDSRGFLWFATQSGLNRWDGYAMRVWQKEPFSRNTLSHNLIQTMLAEKDTLWLGTYGGLDRFDTGTETFRSFRHFDNVPGSLSHNVVTRVYRDRRGVLWVGTLDGLNRLNQDTGTFQVFKVTEGSSSGLSGKTIRSFAEDSQGRLWVGSSEGFDLYDPEADQLKRFGEVFPGAPPLPRGSVMGAVRVGEELWLGIWGQGLVRLDPRTGAYRVVALPDNRVFGLDAEPGELRVGTWGGGLVVHQPATGETFSFKHDGNHPESLANDVVYGTFRDRSGLLWVATNGGGTSRYNPRKQQFQTLATDGKVIVLHRSTDGTLWAGVYNGGLVRFRPDGASTVWRANPADPRALSNDIVNCITEDADGRLWLGTNHGVNIFDPRTGRFTRLPLPGEPEALPDDIVFSIAVDRWGRWWFGTYRSGLVVRTNPLSSQGERTYRAGVLPDDLVYFVDEDREGRLWVGTNGGLALYDEAGDRFETWKYDQKDPQSLPGNTVRGLLEDAQGRFWVTTNGGGVSLVDPGTREVRNIGLAEGLSSLSVFSALERDGKLWISSVNGLFSYDPATALVRRFGTADGLPTAEFASGAALFGDSLAFGSTKGVVLLRGLPARVEAPPLVTITGTRVLGLPRPASDRLTLGWQENAVTFTFSVMDFRSPGRNQYQYRLEGFDREWVNAQDRHEATYTNLWPGRYRFHVRGASPSDVWAESSDSVVLVVEASPWASWYAWTGYAVLFGIMVYLAFRARVGYSMAQKVAELEVLRGQLVEANSRLADLSRQDGLTGIANRRALDGWLKEAWERAARQNAALSVLMIDIDDFKRYNDRYGHAAGDACLKAVARSLSRGLLRTSDFCGRYGGEEFAVVLASDFEGAEVVADRLLKAVDALAVEHEHSGAGHVTVSIGLASATPAQMTLDELLALADQRLYRAKAAGRHQIIKD